MSLGLAPFAEAPVVAPPVAPTFFASASNPADNGALSGTFVDVTPPASMQAGDLVIVTPNVRTVSLTWSVTVTGGQTWNTASAAFGGASRSIGLFWCTFNGTWAANPRFDCVTSGNLQAVMHVFRPDLTTRVWAQDVAFAQTTVAAPSTPFTITRAGLTTVHSRTVSLASWFVIAANTFGSLTGTGWVGTGLAQYRQTTGGQAQSHAHALNAAATVVVPSVSQNESAGTAGHTCIMAWYAA